MQNKAEKRKDRRCNVSQYDLDYQQTEIAQGISRNIADEVVQIMDGSQIEALIGKTAQTPVALLEKIVAWRCLTDETLFQDCTMPDERLLVSLMNDLETYLRRADNNCWTSSE